MYPRPKPLIRCFRPDRPPVLRKPGCMFGGADPELRRTDRIAAWVSGGTQAQVRRTGHAADPWMKRKQDCAEPGNVLARDHMSERAARLGERLHSGLAARYPSGNSISPPELR